MLGAYVTCLVHAFHFVLFDKKNRLTVAPFFCAIGKSQLVTCFNFLNAVNMRQYLFLKCQDGIFNHTFIKSDQN